MAELLTLATMVTILEGVAVTGKIVGWFVEEPGLTREEFYEGLRNERRHYRHFSFPMDFTQLFSV